ncbi:TRAP transporter substrate-binding protein DctP [Histidinibacterium aquaticum]|uniref:C4-dicarboxylate ABC transporter substrate-binding protein n=1 Tax=Histidinibacterium aquaticum TaxID=2613962 RepID=A0A5J5GHY8_9RHOB|nr:TRAP transporter substrate-binding protein DctP [Histidinibacterium aquaticum]KAA9007859.1 C4-dicarboxylate ABC transporter substrate-binding protein [Histidinibacterium aquaticum]
MKLGTTLAMASAIAIAAGTADARDLRVASGAPPPHPATSHLYNGLVENLEAQDEADLTATFLGPEVVSLGQMKDALQTGLVDVGNLLPLYFPAELPNLALAGELSLSGTDPHAMGAALTEYIVSCEACQQEMNDFGMVFLGSGSSDPYVLITNQPVESMDDVAGLRLRSGGAPFSRWAENFGATPVAIGVGETFEAMSQGTIDGTIASIGDLLSFRLVELAEQVTAVPLGTYFSTSNFTTALGTWQDMSPEEREVLARAANLANANFTQQWGYDFPAAAEEAATEAGITMAEAPEDFVTASEEFGIADRETAAQVSMERFGMEDASERVEEFVGLIDKWTAISEELDHDEAAMAERVWEEVWSDVDFSTYGG